MNVEQRMRTALKEGADGLSFPEAGPDAARERAHQRARRRQAGTGGLTALAVVAAGITGWQLLPDEQVRFDRDGGGAADRGGAAIASNALADLEWRDAEGVVGTQKELIYSAEEGAYYALSTAPGTRSADYPEGDVPQALYRSDDGLSWEAAELGATPWIADLDERGGVLYAVSTAPTTGGTGNGRVGISADGGHTWSQDDLPSTAAPPDADVDLEGPSVTASIAVGEDVVLARMSSTYRVPEAAVFTAEERMGGGDGQQNDEGQRYVQQNDEGLSLVEICHGAVMEGRRLDARRGPVGVDDGAVPTPAPQRAAAGLALEAAELARQEEAELARQKAERSLADGTAPQEPQPAGDCPVEGERVVRTMPWSELGLESRSQLRIDELFRSVDGGAWETIDAGPFADRYVPELVAGPRGFLAVAYAPDGSAPELLRSTDGSSWEQVEGMGPVSSLGLAGERIVGLDDRDTRTLDAVTSEDGGATWTRTNLSELVDPEGTAEHIGVYTEGTGPLGAAVVVGTHHDDDDSSTLHLLTSGDGVSWSVTPLSEVVGGDEPTVVPWIAVGADSIALTVGWFAGDPGPMDEPLPTRTFVGTPTR